jgi:hypothetical protein
MGEFGNGRLKNNSRKRYALASPALSNSKKSRMRTEQLFGHKSSLRVPPETRKGDDDKQAIAQLAKSTQRHLTMSEAVVSSG